MNIYSPAFYFSPQLAGIVLRILFHYNLLIRIEIIIPCYIIILKGNKRA